MLPTLSAWGALAAVLALAAPPATAAEDGHFGGAGQGFVSGTSGLDAGVTTHSGEGGSVQAWNIDIGPRVGYFVADKVFLGLGGNIGYLHLDGDSSTQFEIGPALGVRVPTAPAVHFVPALALDYEHVSRSTSLLGTIDEGASSDVLKLVLDLSFLFEVRPGLGFTLGPRVSQQVVNRAAGSGEPRVTRVAVTMGVVGWL